MNKNKHTPGPWKLSGIFQNPNGYGSPVRDVNTTPHDPKLPSVGIARVFDLASANLVVAAPDLLRSLEAILCEIECLVEDGTLKAEYVDSHEEIKLAERVIAKAKGE